MGSLSYHHCVLILWCCFLVAIIEMALPTDVYADGSRQVGIRKLIQKMKCPINFETQNYTIITSECKGPDFTAKLCCAALKKLSCPYVDMLNNQSYDCATTMFSYINLYGKYPPGLFANECTEKSSEGLDCAKINENETSNARDLIQPMTSTIWGAVFTFYVLY